MRARELRAVSELRVGVERQVVRDERSLAPKERLEPPTQSRVHDERLVTPEEAMVHEHQLRAPPDSLLEQVTRR